MEALNVQTPAARNSDPMTSHMAAKELTESGDREKQIRATVAAVRRNPGLTSADLASVAGLDRYAVGRRLSEAQTGGMVTTGEKARSKTTGRLGVTWWPK